MCEHEYLFKVCDLRKYSIMKKQNKIRAEFEQ
jgi:hypothetical protein